ncbi:hypothetical protein OM076_21980 [Solirubrobacter ginsenosidimutans]|jgi:hypothetical protein|uniref:Uncharacterized protein n=1 Tax=Solirubrobacter ginsenosidimutans TaxID=490573 RepID=A0A9X3MV50_9ACTN|nr:hypothetical protein [Solirubrobacter ginsenosidimutans]MDA0162957.1 hypothetical protein [Solirubrobacter ginsenosidimutans]
MASSSKKRTTFAKLNREAAVRDRRIAKMQKKEARKQEDGAPVDETPVVEDTSHLDVAHIPGVTDFVESAVPPKRR